MLDASQETLAGLHQNLIKSQLAIAEQLDREMQDFWERASSTRDAALAGHLAAQAAAVTERLRQALCALAQERDISGEVIIAVVRAIQKHNAATAEAVADLGKVLIHMAEEADALELLALTALLRAPRVVAIKTRLSGRVLVARPSPVVRGIIVITLALRELL